MIVSHEGCEIGHHVIQPAFMTFFVAVIKQMQLLSEHCGC